MKFSAIYKKGYGVPDASDMVEGGLCIDIKNKRAYSMAEDSEVFALGLNLEEIIEWLSTQQTMIPLFGIIMYAGQISAIPAGWAICNGEGSTPDLRNKFVYGTNVQSEIFDADGSAESSMPSHTHTIGGHTHSALALWNGQHNHGHMMRWVGSGGNSQINAADVDVQFNYTMDQAGGHEHNITMNNNASYPTGSAGDSGDDSNLPPYVKLAYIMRVA